MEPLSNHTFKDFSQYSHNYFVFLSISFKWFDKRTDRSNDSWRCYKKYRRLSKSVTVWLLDQMFSLQLNRYQQQLRQTWTNTRHTYLPYAHYKHPNFSLLISLFLILLFTFPYFHHFIVGPLLFHFVLEGKSTSKEVKLLNALSSLHSGQPSISAWVSVLRSTS